MAELPTWFNSGFILSLFAAMTACVGGLTAYMLKSRCSSIRCCCGLLDCQRDVIPPAELRQVETQA